MQMAKQRKHTPWYLVPFVAVWKLVAGIVGLTGRLVAVILGFTLMLVGIVLTVTVIGAIAGIPMLVIGFLLVIKGIF